MELEFSEELRLVRSRTTGHVAPYQGKSQGGAADMLSADMDMEPYYGPVPKSGRTDQSAATPEEGLRLYEIVEAQRKAREKAAQPKKEN